MDTRNARTTGIVTAALLAVVALAGCVGDSGAPQVGGDNAAPVAELEVNRQAGWSDETFRFDAGHSRDPDGNISEYRFAFGDGTEMTVSGDEEPEVTHVYAHGGEFTVTLTVRDDGGENIGALTGTDAITVSVNERRTLGGQVIDEPTGNRTTTYRLDFEVWNGADLSQVDVDVSNLVPAASSEIRVALLGPGGELLKEQTVTIGMGETENVLLDAALTQAGTHAVEIVAQSGAAAATGELRVYYDEDLFDDEAADA